jgi:glutamate racemase
LVYGCTHYPLLAPVIERLLPQSVTLVNPAVQMATAAAQELELLNLKSSQTNPEISFFVSGNPEQFAQSSQPCLGFVPAVEAVQLQGLKIRTQVLEPATEALLPC